MRFQNREDAGKQLAQRLLEYKAKNPLIFALPRGGVPVAYEVAKVFQAPLDVLVARKIGVPGNPELGIGAISIQGVTVLNDWMLRHLQISPSYLQQALRQESQELKRRVQDYRGERPMPSVEGQVVLLIDDGLATGITAKAALLALRQMKPRELIFAIPVCAIDSAKALEDIADQVVCLDEKADLVAVGIWYQDFRQISDTEVKMLLAQNRQEFAHE